MEVQYVNVSLLDASEKTILDSVLSSEGKKLARLIKGESKLVVQVREMNKTGKRKEYNIQLRVESPAATFATKGVVDWDIARCVRKAMVNVEEEIIHRYKKGTSYKKSYS
ncbi:MAG TPA: hypothetical protein VJI46_05785 [Candidatus Nanoarchaeia archaeon]|nr:hypothetical protein [Candidatus Nanoarchaeia archaeon]